jgi:transcription initiation factor TFIIF subunit beta
MLQKSTGATSKAKGQDMKTARMPKNDLLDCLAACFKKYSYWSMKALRAELQQPEAYLREVLDEIADLPKSGRFAMHWKLKASFQDASYETAMDVTAPMQEADAVHDTEMGDADHNANVKFEDVPT